MTSILRSAAHAVHPISMGPEVQLTLVCCYPLDCHLSDTSELELGQLWKHVFSHAAPSVLVGLLRDNLEGGTQVATCESALLNHSNGASSGTFDMPAAGLKSSGMKDTHA
jgi:hypothetical protein